MRLRPRPRTILQGDRPKAFRPIPPEQRRVALDAGLDAYARGDFFEAHELLEPAWMGTSDLAERALYQGLIKLAAGYVHAIRGNPVGMARNLEGARRHLETSLTLDPAHAVAAGIDLTRLIAAVDLRLAAVRAEAAEIPSRPGRMLELADDAPRVQ
jgi:predicted metal-dependent hydrolase